MTFDFGGFTGGIIGTIGAFVIARYSINKQFLSEKPKKSKANYLILGSVKNILSNMSWELLIAHDKLINVMVASLNFIHELENLIPDAIEVSAETVIFIEETKATLEGLNEKFKHNASEEEYRAAYLSEINRITHDGMEKCIEKMKEMKNNSTP